MLKKKEPKEDCRYSIECRGEDAVCFRPFFKKVGLCFRAESETLHSIGRILSDNFFKAGKKVKELAKNVFEKVIKLID